MWNSRRTCELIKPSSLLKSRTGSRSRRLHSFQLHSLPASPAEIPERFSSSLLPPSFAAGRCAAIFLPPKTSHQRATFSFLQPALAAEVDERGGDRHQHQGDR